MRALRRIGSKCAVKSKISVRMCATRLPVEDSPVYPLLHSLYDYRNQYRLSVQLSQCARVEYTLGKAAVVLADRRVNGETCLLLFFSSNCDRSAHPSADRLACCLLFAHLSTAATDGASVIAGMAALVVSAIVAAVPEDDGHISDAADICGAIGCTGCAARLSVVIGDGNP